MLENVALEPTKEGKLIPNYFDVSKTQNGRVSYPIFHIDNYVSFQNLDAKSNSFVFIFK